MTSDQRFGLPARFIDPAKSLASWGMISLHHVNWILILELHLAMQGSFQPCRTDHSSPENLRVVCRSHKKEGKSRVMENLRLGLVEMHADNSLLGSISYGNGPCMANWWVEFWVARRLERIKIYGSIYHRMCMGVQFRHFCRVFPRWSRQPESAGSTFGPVSFTCNVNWQWRTSLRCVLMVGRTSYALEEALVEPVTHLTEWQLTLPGLSCSSVELAWYSTRRPIFFFHN